MSEDLFHTIQPSKNFIIRLPSDNYKIVDLKPKSYYACWINLHYSSISLGKFGTFLADQLIGKPFGPSWEILSDKNIKLLERQVQDDEGMSLYYIKLMRDDVFVRDNRDVFDDGAAQLLTAQEIKEVRAVMSSKVSPLWHKLSERI